MTIDTDDDRASSSGVATPPISRQPVPGSSASAHSIPHLKPGEELLDPALQAKLINRRAKDAERKRKDREKRIAARSAADDASKAPERMALDGVSPVAGLHSPSPSSTHLEAQSSPATHTPIKEETIAKSSLKAASQGDAASKSKAKADKKSAEKAIIAAEKLAAEREAILMAQEEEPTEEEDLLCICRTLYDEEKMMIACDRCDNWYHVTCLKMREDQVQLVDMFICPPCSQATGEYTTWKPVCMRSACSSAARPPLSKYCSDRCGVLVAAARVAKSKYAKVSSSGTEKLYATSIRNATKQEGLMVWAASDHVADVWLDSIFSGQDDDPLDAVDARQNGQEQTQSTTSMKPASLLQNAAQEEETLTDLASRLREATSRRQKVSVSLDLAENRLKLLQLADDRLGVLPPIVAEESGSAAARKPKSKGKAGKQDDGASAVKTQPRCGYDERLAWDEERFAAWMSSDIGRSMLEGTIPLDGRISGPIDESAQADAPDGIANGRAPPSVCGIAKRKCKRHADWNVMKNEEFEIERTVQTATLSRLSEQISSMQAQVAEIEGALRAKRSAEDERLAVALARDSGLRTSALAASNAVRSSKSTVSVGR